MEAGLAAREGGAAVAAAAKPGRGSSHRHRRRGSSRCHIREGAATDATTLGRRDLPTTGSARGRRARSSHTSCRHRRGGERKRKRERKREREEGVDKVGGWSDGGSG